MKTKKQDILNLVNEAIDNRKMFYTCFNVGDIDGAEKYQKRYQENIGQIDIFIDNYVGEYGFKFWED